MHFALDRVSRFLTFVELEGASSLYTGLAIEVPATMTETPATTLAEAVRACLNSNSIQYACLRWGLFVPGGWWVLTEAAIIVARA